MIYLPERSFVDIVLQGLKFRSIEQDRLAVRHPVFIIAEAGVNHNGSLDRAFQMVDAAVSAGADAVKFQTFRAGKIITRGAPKASYLT